MGRAAAVFAVAVSLAVAAPATAEPRRVSTLEPGVFTWLGVHAANVAYNVPSAAACRDRCLADTACKAWQWGTAQNPDTQMRGACVIGTGHESRERRTGARAQWHVSGVVSLASAPPRRQSTVEPGAIYDVSAPRHRLASGERKSAEACRDWCLAVARCAAWTFRAAGGGARASCALGTGHVDRGRAPPARRHSVASGVVGEVAASR